ncbi:surface lipoprotein assembly modifier [Telmatospirillum sp. J64-1]|uniref:surface lipoprotein assembly modifier n=1 Tax=Telmatospirillum sp. J64-1 TaxID=2502183 RepID=UPI00163D736E|nr:porin family protein [Telmatospirillum sp. J64-1]
MAPARAQEAREITDPAEIEAVVMAASARMLVEGQAEEAYRLLKATEGALTSKDGRFQLGLAALETGRHDEAAAIFRRLLADDPGSPRLRLAMARAQAMAGEEQAAMASLRRVLIEDVPDMVRERVRLHLAEINRRRRWSAGFDFALVADDNINGATNVEEIWIHGVPFTLSKDARRRPGTGVAATLYGQVFHPLGEDWRLRAGGSLHHVDYEGGFFDDTTLSGFAGPAYSTPNAEVSLVAAGYRRWYGGTPYSHALGPRLEIGGVLGDRLRLDGRVEYLQVTHRNAEWLDGPAMTALLAATYALDRGLFLRGFGGVRREQAEEEPYRNTTLRGGVALYAELPWGINAQVEQEISTRRFDAPIMIFGPERRKDTRWLSRLSVVLRHFEWQGFLPKLGVSYEKQDSTIALYEFDRTQLEFGVTREF